MACSYSSYIGFIGYILACHKYILYCHNRELISYKQVEYRNAKDMFDVI